MVIEYICQYPSNIVMGVSAGVGALAFAGFSIYTKKKQDKNFVFDYKRILDTTWQSVIAGMIAGMSLGCGYLGLLTAMVTGVGVDKITNRLKIGETAFLNIVQLIANLLTKADKKKR